MPIQIKIEVKNLQEIRRAFQQFPEKIIPELKTAVIKSALMVEREAKILAPVDTGRLRSSINTSYGIGTLGIGARVATDVEYAIYVHEGTRRMRARPFMAQAVSASESMIQDFFNRAVEVAVSKIQ